MIERKHLKNYLLSWAITCVFCMFSLCTPIKSVEQPLAENDNVPIEMPWSIKAEQALQKQQDKFKYIDSYYNLRTSKNLGETFLWLTLAFIGTVLAILFTIFRRGLSLPLFMRFVGVFFPFLMLLWILQRGREAYGLHIEKGYFFLTDTGLLIIEPGYSGKDVWLYYHNIDDIQVLASPGKYQSERFLRIIIKGGKVKVYSSYELHSPHIFQSFYNRLIDVYKNAKSQQESIEIKNQDKAD